MRIKNIKPIAQEIIKKTESIVAPNTVNLMDENGIIIASSDENRIGTFHSGAYQAIQEKREINIYPNEVEKFEGAKQGINIPIIKNNKAIAVIGIFGNPDEVKQTAYLLSISTSLFLDQDDNMKKEQRRIELRNNLSELIFTKDCKNEFIEICEALSITIKYPLIPTLIYFDRKKPKYEQIYNLLYKNNIIKPSSDILLEYPTYFILLKSSCINSNITEKLLSTLEITNPTCIIKGKTILDICEINKSINLAKAFIKLPCKNQFYDCMNYDDLSLLVFDSKSKDLLNICFYKLLNILENETSYWIFKTIDSYIKNDGKVQSISNELNIHKNTCIYRINKILNLCNLQNCNCFTVSYFFRAIMHIKKTNTNTREV